MIDVLDYIANKYGLDINQRSPIVVPGLSRIGLASMLSELGCKNGVEIGVQGGNYSKVLAEANPTMDFYGIDPWLEYPELPIWGEQAGQDFGYEFAKARVPSNCILIRKKSMDAVKDFPDNYFDFVYVDGNHEFYAATEDIHYWLQKVRVGGILAGHDYRRYYPRSFIHVHQVVHAFTDAYDIKPWFVTDPETEKVRSFFWVKTEFPYRRNVEENKRDSQLSK